VIELLTDIAEHLPSPLALFVGQFLNEISNTLLTGILLGSTFLISCCPCRTVVYQ
jgi:hypothetical protein